MPSQTPDAAPAPAPAPGRRRTGTLYLVGVDGLTLDVIEPMARQGELPNLRRLAAEGAHGPLSTIEPTNSALLWTTIATGRHHRDHGIDGFTSYRLLGLDISRTALRRARKLGLRRPIKWLQAANWLKRQMLDSRCVRCKTLWDIISQAGGASSW